MEIGVTIRKRDCYAGRGRLAVLDPRTSLVNSKLVDTVDSGKAEGCTRYVGCGK